MAAAENNDEDRVEALFRRFRFEKVINEDASHHTVHLLGTISGEEGTDKRAVVILSKTAFPTEPETWTTIHTSQHITHTQTLGQNDVYLWAVAWLHPARPAVHNSPDLKLQIIFPATELHIRKYTKQDHKIIRETPQLYQQVVLPYINAIPPTRLSWLYNILDHVTEADKIVYEDPSDTDGFMIMPDLKWDQSTRSSLYLLCIVRNRGIRSLRDLRPRHLGMLQTIRARAAAAIEEKYQVSGRELRMFVHYQPSYYHFHVHITHVDHLGFNGIAVGQAHLLDDVIDNLAQELRRASPGPSLYEAKTFTYALGSHHALFEPLWARQLPDF